MKELTKAYNPRETEEGIFDYWKERRLFKASPSRTKKPYCIVIPPPNVTGILHMGHALNNTIQDILIRYKRMAGFEALWMPGTDHAGIATQNAVEKSIAKEGLKRQDLGREQFTEKVWRWKEEYGSTIIRQLKKLGASCDWDRTRFTMDDAYSDAVLEVFKRLYDKGLIYRGNYIINWCPRCRTALSDEEAPHREIDGHLYYIKYPLQDLPKEHIVVATTRPETMLGDTAVAVNPKDKRYKRYIGSTLILPLMKRKIKIIADGMVDKDFGTGAVKVTPAHDPNDYALGKTHKLDFINVMNPDATMNENAGDFEARDRFEAREAIIEELKEQGLLLKVEPHKISAGHCYRCHTIIEPYLSKQWFIKMKPLAGPAIDVVKKGRVKFHPKRWTKVYLNWMEQIQDWCISRQIWWGHRIPVYYCKSCCEKSKDDSKGIIVSKTRPERCPLCGSADIEQDPDVLDTWFSSWLWPFATMYWPEETEELKYFYPTDALVTAQEIIFFWVARMIMAGLEFTGKEPFRDVYIHGTVRDDTGTKMSKSLGNVIDPLQIIDKFGADALRFSIIMITATGQDVFLSPQKFEIGRNFANKIWNATRFIQTILKDKPPLTLAEAENKGMLKTADKWILSRFFSSLKKITDSIERYRFNDAASAFYEFFWHRFCDWYIEFAKMTPEDEGTKAVLNDVLCNSLKVLHPFMPFITEKLWQSLPQSGEPLTVSRWPEAARGHIDPKLDRDMEDFIELVTAIRNIRSEWNIDQKAEIEVVLSFPNKKAERLAGELEIYLKRFCRLKGLKKGMGLKKPPHAAYGAPAMAEVYVPLEGVIDFERESARLKRQKADIEKRLDAAERRLKDKFFIRKAPKEVVERNRASADDLKATLKRLNENLKNL